MDENGGRLWLGFLMELINSAASSIRILQISQNSTNNEVRRIYAAQTRIGVDSSSSIRHLLEIGSSLLTGGSKASDKELADAVQNLNHTGATTSNIMTDLSSPLSSTSSTIENYASTTNRDKSFITSSCSVKNLLTGSTSTDSTKGCHRLEDHKLPIMATEPP